MPRLSDSMEEGTILRWLKAAGDEVAHGDELVEIETDKANMVYEADQDGPLEIVAQEGATLPIGAVIARIGGGDGPAAAAVAPAAAAVEQTAGPKPAGGAAAGGPAAPVAPGAATPVPAAAPGGGGNGRLKASPVARRMARELGLDLAALAGSGPGGRIVKADVEAAAAGGAAAATPAAPAPASPAPPAPVAAGMGEPGAAKGEVTPVELSKTQQVIARRMAESKATVPDFTLTTEVEASSLVELRSQLKALGGETPVPSFNDMVVKACALALREHPRANGAYRDGRFELFSRVNVGVAVAAEDALVVPTVFDADRKSLGEIAREARALAERVRAGRITPPELAGGTFTVSNLGMFGITQFSAVINPPQAAILAVGALREAAVVRDGVIAAGHLMTLTLSCDHRILYGAAAAEFLAAVRGKLEAPLALAL